MSIPPKLALLEEFAMVARALGAPQRLVMLEQLGQGERGVEDLARKVGISVANCSQHLQTLRRAGLVTSRRQGKSVIYAMSDAHVLSLMNSLSEVAERNLAEVERILRGLSDGAEPPQAMTRDELEMRLADGSVTVIDLRPIDEFERAHLPGATHVPLEALEGFSQNHDPTREVIAYCRGPYCLYSHQAVARLRARGLIARRMEGGLPEWRADARQIEGAEDGTVNNSTVTEGTAEEVIADEGNLEDGLAAHR